MANFNVEFIKSNIKKSNRDRYNFSDDKFNNAILGSYSNDSSVTDPIKISSVSFDATNPISISFTLQLVTNNNSVNNPINHQRLSNYCRVYSEAFSFDIAQHIPNWDGNLSDGKIKRGWMYYFVDSVEILGTNVRKYTCSLDSVSTFGHYYLNQYGNGIEVGGIKKYPEVLVNRLHDLRYLVERAGSQFNTTINKDARNLINSDFTTSESVGQQLAYIPMDVSNGGNGYFTPFKHEGSTNLVVDNSVTIYDHKNIPAQNSNVWFRYAVVQVKGEPSWVALKNSDDTIICRPLSDLTTGIGVSDPNGSYETGFDSFKIVVPLGNMSTSSTTLEGITINRPNIMDIFPEGKVLSIFLSPLKLNLGMDNPNTSYNGNIECNYALVTSKDADDLNKDKPASMNNLGQLLNEGKACVFGFLPDFAYLNGKGNTTETIIPFVAGNTFPNFPNYSASATINNQLTWQGDSKLINIMQNDILNTEIGIFHNAVTRREVIFKGAPEATWEIDNYLPLVSPRNSIIASVFASDTGVLMSVNAYNQFFHSFELRSNLNTYSDSGTTYLNNNRYYMDAQKTAIHVQDDLQRKRERLNSGSNIVGGVFSAIGTLGMSGVGNIISGGGGASFANNEMYDNENAQKDIINSQLKDASNAPASIHYGSGNEFALSDNLETIAFATLKITKPNEMSLKQMAIYYERFGSKYDIYTSTKPITTVSSTQSYSWYERRYVFNYVKITNSSQYFRSNFTIAYNGGLTPYNLSLNSNVVDDLDNELSKGVRIWRRLQYDNYDGDNVDLIYNVGENLDVTIANMDVIID